MHGRTAKFSGLLHKKHAHRVYLLSENENDKMEYESLIRERKKMI